MLLDSPPKLVLTETALFDFECHLLQLLNLSLKLQSIFDEEFYL